MLARLAGVFAALVLPVAALHADDAALAAEARRVLVAHCHRCHGKDGANEGGLNFVADLKQLVARKRVVPGQAKKSKILARMLDADDPMPPAEEKSRPSQAELEALRQWIDAGAPSGEANSQRAYLSVEAMIAEIRRDLEKANERDRRFLRYFTLTHLANAGLSQDQLQSYRHALAKLVNSLSWQSRMAVPTAVDAERTILRIDLRDLGWNEKTWEKIVEKNPYDLRLEGSDITALAEMTGSPLPYVRGDWFAAVGARPPLYHDILELPTSERELEKMLRLDTAENVRQERAFRAGFNSSGVSRNNRLIERHDLASGVYWKSYDFAGNIGRQNLFAHPLGPGDAADTFLHDGGEIIFSLPNGLHAYFLAESNGRRIDKGPTTIVSDPRRPDRAVENGLSCMSCHARGMIEKTDQVRAHALKNKNAFSKSSLDTVLALYPAPEKMTALMRADAKKYQEAVLRTGSPLSTTEPISALAMRFEAELDLPLAAAEAGVTPRDLLRSMARAPHLARFLGPLQIEGGTIQRQAFVDGFSDLATALRPLRRIHPRNIEAVRAVDQGRRLLGTDPNAALKVFQRALELDPENADAHAGRGDVFRFRQELDNALEAYGEALRLDLRQSTIFNNRGLTFQRKGEHAKAVADFSAALRLDPNSSAALYNRGVSFYQEDELDKAIADFTEALRIDPKFTMAFNNRGYAHLEKDEFDRALADFDEAVRLDPKFAIAHNNRGLANLGKKRFAQAVADFTEAIRLRPNFAKAFLNRADARRRLGETTQADRDRRRAFELDPNLAKE